MLASSRAQGTGERRSGRGGGGVWWRVVVCAARRPVRVIHGLTVHFSIYLSIYLAWAEARGCMLGAHRDESGTAPRR